MKKTFTILMILFAVSSTVFARRAETPASTNGVGIMKKGSTFHVYYKSPNAANVKVNIYDANNKIVFTETIRKVDGFVRPYNFSDLAYGEYTIEIQEGNQRLTEKVSYAPKVNNLAHVTKVTGSDNKYVVAVPNKTQDVISVKIYNDNTLLHQEQLQILNDFAKVYNLGDVKGKVSFEVTDSKGNSKVVSY